MVSSKRGSNSTRLRLRPTQRRKPLSPTHTFSPEPDIFTHPALHRLQRTIGNQAVTRLLTQTQAEQISLQSNTSTHVHNQDKDQRAKPASAQTPVLRHPSNLIQRRVKITFEEPDNEMEEFDTSTAKIIDVLAERDRSNVAVENQYPGSAQKAHTTSHVVFTYMLVRDLDQKTWVEAWQMLKNKYQFLHNLVTRWYGDNTLNTGSNATLRNQLPNRIQAAIDSCDEELTRGGHPITAPVWGARPLNGGPNDWQYYDHQPNLLQDNIDGTTHLIKPWKLMLTSTAVHRLEDACEQWMVLRGQIPWTSVKTGSYVTSDRMGPNEVEGAASSYGNQPNLANNEAKEISDAIILTFDFFPPSFTQSRTYEHAAAVAARHVVEHFQYHESILPAWRDTIASQFLVSWQEKITRERALEKKITKRAKEGKQRKKRKVGTTGTSKVVYGRKTAALKFMLDNWNLVTQEFNRTYNLLKAAIV